MPINPNIALGVQPLHIQQVDPNAGMNALMRAMQIKSAMGENDLRALQMQEHQRGLDETNALNDAWRSSVGEDGSVNHTKLYSLLAQKNLGAKIPAVQKQVTEAQEAQIKLQNEAAKGYNLFRKTVGAHAALPNPSPEAVAADIQDMVAAGAMNGAVAQRMLSAMPADPQQLRVYLQRAATSQMDPQHMLTVFAPKPTEVDDGQQKFFRDTNPQSPTYGQMTAGAPVQKQQDPNSVASVNATLRGQNLTDARARAQQDQAERHFQAGQNAPQYMETDAGLVALPKRVAAGQAPVGTPVMGPNGQPLGKPLKDIPPAVNSAIIQNTQSLNQIDRAMTLLGGTDIGDPAQGGQRGDKAATGMKGYLPQTVLNRLDPKGVDARAEVADIGSLKIHDRSGAAVTISESPRLMPFIPQATDDAATVKKKLARLKTELVNESNALAQTYSREQGYKPNPVQPAAPGGLAGFRVLGVEK